MSRLALILTPATHAADDKSEAAVVQVSRVFEGAAGSCSTKYSLPKLKQN